MRTYGLLALSSVLMFLGFAGFGFWPLAFVGMIPALYVLDPERERAPISRWAFFRRALFFGYVAYYGGFYWVVNTIVDFGGFPYLLALLFASIYFVFRGLQFVLVLWLWRRARAAGFNATLALVAAYVGVELAYPMLFDHFYGNSFHMLPGLIQVADIGGPTMLTALAMAGNGAVYELIVARLDERPWPRAAPAAFAGYLLFCLGYSAYRIDQTETRAADSEHLDVGVVQANMSIVERARLPGESPRRHLEDSLALEAQGPLDLIVWPESSTDFRTPRAPGTRVDQRFAQGLAYFRRRYPGYPSAPVLFGGASTVTEDGESSARNTAFLIDEDAEVVDLYDKTYLLMWGEYIPFGETFPILYEWSPNSGHFTSGGDVDPLVLGEHRIGALVCYEDVLPRFTRRVVSEGDPHLLVNMTNDGWFGQTHEPHVHLALAKFRAVEHHRPLVRATLTGISAVIDPVGRVVTEAPLNERATLRASVPMLDGWTPYQTLGDWPGWLGLLGIAWMVRPKPAARRRKSEPSPPDGEEEE